MDFGEESELEDLIEEIREQSNESYYPFPSKIFALLYLLVNSPHPMVWCYILLLLLTYLLIIFREKVTSLLFGLFLKTWECKFLV